MLDNISFKPQGYVCIQRIKHGEQAVTLYERHNEILPQAQEIMANALAGNVNFLPNQIEVHNQGLYITRAYTLVPVTANVTGVGNSAYVEYRAIFETSSFSGFFDKLLLRAADADFAQFEMDQALEKQPDEQILIIWKITIN